MLLPCAHDLDNSAQSLCLACGSDPKNGTERKLGAYIMKTCFQTTTISSAMFITAMAANPLAVRRRQPCISVVMSMLHSYILPS